MLGMRAQGHPVLISRRVRSGFPLLDLALLHGVLGGSWVVISGVISPLIWVISLATLLITPFITTHEPPSTA